MSDLAPFVAATLKDAATIDLLQENEVLREKLRQTKIVSITGPGGSPVYASGHVTEDGWPSDPGQQGHGEAMWTVEVWENAIPCPVA